MQPGLRLHILEGGGLSYWDEELFLHALKDADGKGRDGLLDCELFEEEGPEILAVELA